MPAFRPKLTLDVGFCCAGPKLGQASFKSTACLDPGSARSAHLREQVGTVVGEPARCGAQPVDDRAVVVLPQYVVAAIAVVVADGFDLPHGAHGGEAVVTVVDDA